MPSPGLVGMTIMQAATAAPVSSNPVSRAYAALDRSVYRLLPPRFRRYFFYRNVDLFVRMFPQTRYVVSVGKQKMPLGKSSITEAHVYYDELYEPRISRFVSQFLKLGDCFLDVGANVGYFTTMAAALVGPQGRVISFEPNPEVRGVLEAQVLANGFTNVSIRPVGIGRATGRADLVLGEKGNHGSTSLAPKAEGEIEIVSLDSEFDRSTIAGKILLKIDVEGLEPDVMIGAACLLAALRPGDAIIMEFSPNLMSAENTAFLRSEVEKLIASGADCFILDDDPTYYFWPERRYVEGPRPADLDEIVQEQCDILLVKR